MLNLKFKRLTDSMQVPTKAHERDACFDIYADIKNRETDCSAVYFTDNNSKVIIPSHETRLIPTGFSTNIPSGYWAAIFARSGLSSKKGLRPVQGVAVIDEQYTGEWFIPLHNDTDYSQTIEHGDRIAQFMLLPYFPTKLIEVETLENTVRGSSGFGSSGK